MGCVYTKSELEEICKNSQSYNQVLVKTGRNKGGANISILKKYIQLYQIDTSHFSSSTSPQKEQKNITELKTCVQCHHQKRTNGDFYWQNGYPRNICKKCVQQNEKEKYKTKVQLFNDYKKTLQCEKCGEARYYLLDFHHRNPVEKDYAISDHARSPLDEIKKEIEKCDVLCANCHREWHYLSSEDENFNYCDWLGE